MNENIIKALQSGIQHTRTKKSALKTTHFASEFSLDYTDFYVKVEGIGALCLPLEQEQIEKLVAFSSPAKFGFREKTLLDTNVRDTHEIPSDKIKISCNVKAFNSMLETMGQKLGLSKNVSLSAHLHNMLIYQSGQFFKTHQDSEKLDNMVASLVVILPSAHIGGDLIIEHKNEKHRFSSENLNSRDLKCVAFYADCKHEVENSVVLNH